MKPLVLAAVATLTSLSVAVWAFGDGRNSQTPPPLPSDPEETTPPLCVVYDGPGSCGQRVDVPCECITMPPIECPDGKTGTLKVCTGGYTYRWCQDYSIYVPADEGYYAHIEKFTCCINYVCLSEGGAGAGVCKNTCTGLDVAPCGEAPAPNTYVYILVPDGGDCNVAQTK